MPRLLREPLLHFLLLGAILFAVYSALNRADGDPAVPAQKIQVGARDVEWLVESWARQWRRPPTAEERRTLVTDHVNEQLLAREARALGLDDDDVVLRRRLAQKLTFIIEGTLRRVEPTDDELQSFYDANAGRFRSEARISFVHVYFDPGHRTDALSDATAALKTLMEAESPGSGEGIGDRSLIETRFQDETETDVSRVFGPDFARTVLSLNRDTWSGPIRSGYGLHLVRVSQLREARPRPLAEVRAQVTAEWKHAQESVAKERYLADLRKKYSVVLDDTVKSLLAATPAEATGTR